MSSSVVTLTLPLNNLTPSLLVVEAKEDLTACPNNSPHRASKELKIEFMMMIIANYLEERFSFGCCWLGEQRAGVYIGGGNGQSLIRGRSIVLDLPSKLFHLLFLGSVGLGDWDFRGNLQYIQDSVQKRVSRVLVGPGNLC